MTAPSVLSHLASTGPEFLPAAPRRAQRRAGFGNSRQSGPQVPEGAVLTFDGSNPSASAAAPFDAWIQTVPAGPFGGRITVINSGSSTFEAWIQTTVTTEQTIFAAPNGNGGALAGITIVGNQIQVYWGDSGLPAALCDDTTPVSDGSWHHIAVSFDDSGDQTGPPWVTFYKDGAGVAGVQMSGVVGVAGTAQLGGGFGSSASFVGALYDVRWWSSVREQADIAAQRFTVPSGSEVSLAFASSFDRTDNQVRNRIDSQVGAVTGGSVLWAELPSRPTYVLQLTGDPADYANIGGPVAPVSTDGSTFECWLQMSTDPGVSGTDQNLLAFGPGLDGAYIYYSGQQTGPDTVGTDWRSSAPLSLDTRPISDGGWHHVAVVFDRGSVTFYKDGVPTTESLSMPAPYTPRASGSQPQIGAASEFGNPQSFNGYIYDARVWGVARQIDEIQSFMYATLNGDEADLVALCNFNGADAALPDSLNPINEVTSVAGSLNGNAAVVAADLPIEPLPTNVWSIPLPGISPIGPKLDTLGLVSVQTVQQQDGSLGAQLTSVDIQSATVNWTWPSAGPVPSRQAAPALATGSGLAWVGLQNPDDPTQAELYGVNMADGSQAWDPVSVEGFGFCTGLVPGAGGVAFITFDPTGGAESPALYFVDATGELVFTTPIPADNPESVCDPVISGDTVFTVSNVTQDTQQAILSAYSISGGGAPVWDPPAAPQIPFWVSAALAANGMIYVVGNGGSVLALDPSSGAQIWAYPNGSGAPINSAHSPVVVGGALYIGGTDGNLYALDADTGVYLWQVDTGSTIITDLIAEDTVLSFANQGDGQDTPPTFFAVDTVGGGQDVLTYPVPAANTILSAQGAVNGVVYFYGEQVVYSVNMDSLLREFRVVTQLIVEDYDTTPPANGGTTTAPTGSDTSFRVTLTLTDELQYPRPKQAVKLWASSDLYITNYLDSAGNPLHINATDTQWLETDAGGNLALAISAYDDGAHGGTSASTPLLVCPALFAWSNFMAPQESIVIYPDHDHLAALSNIQGSAPTELADTAGPQPLYLDQAYGYDTSSPMVSSNYQNANDYGAIAQGLQNIVGTVDPTTLNAVSGSSPTDRRYLANRPMPNVAFRPVGETSTQRQYNPVNANFTMTLQAGTSGTSTFIPGGADLSRPANLPPALLDLSGLSDFDNFVTRVVKGVEKLVVVAWQDADAGITAALHGVEHSFTFAITCLEDAVTVCIGFLKSVVDDIRKAIQWLSALFNWEHILANHNFLKQLIANPNPNNDPAITTGILQQLQTWVSGTGMLSGTLSSQMQGQGASSIGSTSGALQGSTAQSSAGTNTDPQAAVGTAGAGAGGQSTWMHQKFQEKSGVRDAQNGTSGGASLGRSSAIVLPTFGDSDTVATLMENFVSSVEATIKNQFSTFPAQLDAKMTSIKSSLSDPKSLLGTGFADILAVFATLADDMIDLGIGIADDFAVLVAGLITEMIDSLTQPLDIPFITDLWKMLTGDQLTILDMVTLLMAVPATVLISIITGSGVAPGELETSVGLGSQPWNAQDWEFLVAGIAAFEMGTIAAISDGFSFFLSAVGGAVSEFDKGLVALLVSIDMAAWLVSMGVSLYASNRSGGSAWEAKDWAFWSVQFVPIAVNYAYAIDGGGPGPGVLLGSDLDGGIARDLLYGVIQLTFSAAWAGKWPASYRDAPDAKGLVISANMMPVLANLSDLASLAEQFYITVGAKVLTGIIGAGLNFGGFIAPLVAQHA